MSRLKSFLFSVLVSPRRRYDPKLYGDDYYSQLPRDPNTELCRFWAEYCKPRNVLDVGFGGGAVLRGFLELGIDAHGVEPFAAAWDKQSDLRGRVSEGGVSATGHKDSSFDLVTCLDVLEHIPAEEVPAALRELLRVSRGWVLLNICTWTDSNAPLDSTHITLRSIDWWKRRTKEAGGVVVPHPADWPNPRSTLLVKAGPQK